MPIMWKDEDEVRGVPFGPAWLIDDSGVIQEALGWMTKPEAIELAEGNNTEFEEA